MNVERPLGRQPAAASRASLGPLGARGRRVGDRLIRALTAVEFGSWGRRRRAATSGSGVPAPRARGGARGARPTVALAPAPIARCGGGLAVPLLIGFRRLSADPGVTVLAALAVGLVIGSVAMSTMLTDSSTAMLREKASTFLGSDLVVGVNRGERCPLARVQGHPRAEGEHERRRHQRRRARHRPRELRSHAVGTDRRTATSQASSRRSRALTTSRPGECDRRARGAAHRERWPTRPTARSTFARSRSATWFPGYRNGATMVVVDRAALEASDLGLATRCGFTIRRPTQCRSSGTAVSWFAVRRRRTTSSRPPASSRCGGRTRCSRPSASSSGWCSSSRRCSSSTLAADLGRRPRSSGGEWGWDSARKPRRSSSSSSCRSSSVP